MSPNILFVCATGSIVAVVKSISPLIFALGVVVKSKSPRKREHLLAPVGLCKLELEVIGNQATASIANITYGLAC